MLIKRKAIVGILLVFCLLASLFAGCIGKKEGEKQEGTTTAPQEEELNVEFPLKEPITIELATAEHTTQGRYSWAEDGHPGFKKLEEETNIKLKVTHIPVANVKERMNLMLATDSLPDLLHTQGSGWTLNDVEKAGEKGLLVNILDEKYKPLIPRYLKLIEETPTLKGYINDGKLFGFYQVDPGAALFTLTLPYRKDIWDKHNLNVETWDELYEALKTLKKEYPNSYPFGGFSQGGTIVILEYGPPSFRTGKTIYYNYDKNEWVYGPMEDNYKLFLEFFAKLYKEELLNPEFVSMPYEQWSQSWINDETFFSYWWSATGEWFSPNNSSKNPNFGRDKEWVEAHRVPSIVKGGPRGWTSNQAPTNVSVPKVISSKSKYIKEIMALMDYICTVEWDLNLSYGLKGEEWDIVDGKYRFLSKEIITPYNPDGTKDTATYFREKYNVYMSENNFTVLHDSNPVYDLYESLVDLDYKQFLDECDMYVKDGSTLLQPQPVMRFTDEETEIATQLRTSLNTYSDEISIQIINGTLLISEFDNMRKTLEEMGVQDLINLYKKASGK